MVAGYGMGEVYSIFTMTCIMPVGVDLRVRPLFWADTRVGHYECFT
jgi:hypothetical protein